MEEERDGVRVVASATASDDLLEQAIRRTEERIGLRSLEKEDRDHEYRLLARLRALRK